MLLEIVLITLTIITLITASYTDLKTKEVPDWISYGLIFTALGIRSIFAIELGWEIIFSGVLGFLVCLVLALLFYHTNQWGGADSKLLMGMGAVIGISYPFNADSFNLLWFFFALLFIGAIYGVLWLVFLAIKNRTAFTKTFTKKLKVNKKIHLIIGLFSFAFLIITFFNYFFWPFIVFPIVLFYLFLFTTSVEEECFVKEVSPKKLTEGDWLVGEVSVNGKKVMGKKTLEMKDIEKLKHLKLNTVKIKEGIPFVPSFLFAYLLIIFGKNLVEWVINIII